MTVYIVPVVEGQTEQGCIERLLHRLWGELLCRPERLQVLPPFRGDRSKLTQPSGEALTNAVTKAYVKVQAKQRKDPHAQSLVLILLDAEKGGCPAELGPRLLGIAQKALPDGAACACIVAKRMFENWIVAGASPLAEVTDFPDDIPPRDRPEECNGEDWLNKQLRRKNPRRAYDKTADSEAFVRKIDLVECRDNAPSFDKLCRDLESIFPKPSDDASVGDAGEQ